MVKKTTFLVISACLLLLLPLKAQILLFEDFPANSTFPDDYDGWTVINEPTANRHWMIDERGGLYCDGSYGLVYDPVKTEYAITPEFNLPGDDNYGIRFTWIANQIYLIDRGGYDFHIGVTEDDGANWDIIWSASNQEDVEKSGVLFPWESWLEYTSTVSLKDYKGKKIKVAFIYELIDPINENMVRILQMRVLPHEPIETPIVGGSASYNFDTCYLGVKQKSYQTLYLANQGIGSLEIAAIEGLEGTDFSTDLVPGKVTLTSQATHEYYVYYTPTETGAASVTMTIKTNGGDHQVVLSGSKKSVPAGYVLESFEGNEFPPAGWEVNGEWKLDANARSGDYAVSAFFVNRAELMSPRLDLSGNDPYTVTFDYAQIVSNDEAAGNTFYLERSDNGGITWGSTPIWSNSVVTDLPYGDPVTVTLASGSNNVHLRWVYAIEGSLGFEDVSYATVYLDNIIYPTPYGANEVPSASAVVSPVNNAINREVNELRLVWRGVVHADGYRVYVGKNASSLELVTTVDADAVLSYELNGLDYNTTYYWQVIPYNKYGDATGTSVWSFTTMQDQSIKTFPYFQGFEGNEFPELGWKIIDSEIVSRSWDRTSWNTYNGNYSLYVSGPTLEGTKGYSMLQSPEIFLPENTDMQISFVWANRLPAGLSKAPGNESVEEDITGDRLYFEVKTPTTDWEVLTYATSTTHWQKEKVLLSKYKGERITVRWRLQVENPRYATGGALDDVEISTVSDLGVPVITYRGTYKGKTVYLDKWDAGVLNYKQTYNSGKVFTLANEGEHPLKIKSVSFSTSFFDTSLGSGMEIEANKSLEFDMSFVALEHQPAIEDKLHIEFEDGQTCEFPVIASALGATTYCYTFEDAPAFAISDFLGFKTLTQGASSTIDFETSSFPNKGGSYAYMVMNYDEADFHIAVPRSGKQTLLASGPAEGNVEKINWLITPVLTPLETAQVRFYAKILNEYWAKQYLTVLVSTTDNQVSSFVAVPEFTYVELQEVADDGYIEYIVDLSQYANQDIYVAFKHESVGGFVMVMDDIYFENFAFPDAGEQKPIFMTEPVTEGFVGQAYTYSFTVRDLDEDNLKVTIKGQPSWMTYTEVENEPGRLVGTLSGTPATVDNYLIRIEATDSMNETYQEFELKITDADYIAESIVGQFKVYPNPAIDLIHIDGLAEGTVTITDLAGKEIYRQTNVSQVPVSQLSVGMYLLKIHTKEGIYTTPVIRK